MQDGLGTLGLLETGQTVRNNGLAMNAHGWEKGECEPRAQSQIASNHHIWALDLLEQPPAQAEGMSLRRLGTIPLPCLKGLFSLKVLKH